MKTYINCTSSQLEAKMEIAACERGDFQLRLRQRPEPQLKINALARGNLRVGPETNPMMRPRVKYFFCWRGVAVSPTVKSTRAKRLRRSQIVTARSAFTSGFPCLLGRRTGYMSFHGRRVCLRAASRACLEGVQVI